MGFQIRHESWLSFCPSFSPNLSQMLIETWRAWVYFMRRGVRQSIFFWGGGGWVVFHERKNLQISEVERLASLCLVCIAVNDIWLLDFDLFSCFLFWLLLCYRRLPTHPLHFLLALLWRICLQR